MFYTIKTLGLRSAINIFFVLLIKTISNKVLQQKKKLFFIFDDFSFYTSWISHHLKN